MEEYLVYDQMSDGYYQKEAKSPITDGLEYKVLRSSEQLGKWKDKECTPNKHDYGHVEIGDIEIAVHAVVESREDRASYENVNSCIIQSDWDAIGSGRHRVEQVKGRAASETDDGAE